MVESVHNSIYFDVEWKPQIDHFYEANRLASSETLVSLVALY